MNVVALAGVSGISQIPVTHGLGALPAAAPANPLLALSGAENEEWWQKRGLHGEAYDATLGYVRTTLGDGDVAWELGEDAYGTGPVTLGQFTNPTVASAKDEAKRAAFAAIIKELVRQDIEETRQREQIVKISITAAGVTYVALKVLPLL